MAQVISNSGHDDMIHDAVLDYYGRRLATSSSDKTIKIFEVEQETHRLLDTLKGHDAPVWCVTFSHPKHGPLLASSSYDGRILIWRENNPSTGGGGGGGPQQQSGATYAKVFDFAQHTASVNLVAWSPPESGCLLAGASSDGTVSILEHNTRDGSFVPTIVPAHATGVNSVSWAPSISPGAIASASVPSTQGAGGLGGLRRFVTGGSDCLVKIWDFDAGAGTYSCVKELPGHKDWVRDVAWAPTVLSKSYIASASQDKSVRIWTSAQGAGKDGVAGEWACATLSFEAVAWRVSWSLSGNVLAVSTGDNRVTLWKERLSGGWENVKTIVE